MTGQREVAPLANSQLTGSPPKRKMDHGMSVIHHARYLICALTAALAAVTGASQTCAQNDFAAARERMLTAIAADV